jgi:hypothetical protein
MEKVFTEDEISRSATGASAVFSTTLMALYTLIRNVKPDTVVQTGVASGVSSSLILLALKTNKMGKLIDIDIPNREKDGYKYGDGTVDPVYTPENREPGWLIPDELRERWELHLGESKKILPSVDKCDIFYHDSEHSYENMMFEYNWAYSKLKNFGILASDDIGWNSAWKDFHNKHKDLLPLLGHLDFGISQKKAV